MHLCVERCRCSCEKTPETAGLFTPRKQHRAQVVRIDGSTDSRDRFEGCQRFNHTENHRFALISVTAGGVGIDLSQAAVVVFAELPTEAGLVQQAEARAHRRGGQAHGVTGETLVWIRG